MARGRIEPTDPRLLGSLALLLSCGAWVNIQFNSFLFESKGLRPDQIGLVNALGAVAALFSPVLAGWWSDRSGRPQLVLSFYFLATAVLLVVLPHLDGLVQLGIGYFLLQVAFLPVAPLSQTIVLLRSCRTHGDFLAIPFPVHPLSATIHPPRSSNSPLGPIWLLPLGNNVSSLQTKSKRR